MIKQILLILFLSLAYLGPFSSTVKAQTQPKQYEWVFLGGTLQPINTEQGVGTPVVIIRHQDPSEFRNHFLLKTAILTFSQKLSKKMDFNFFATLRVTGDFNGLYKEGVKQKGPQLYADSMENSLAYRFYGDDALRAINLELGLKDYIFSAKEGASDADKEVQGYFEGRVSLKGNLTAQTKEREKSLFSFDLSSLNRATDTTWALERVRQTQSQRYLAQWEGQKTSGQGVTNAKIEAGASDKLDFMNSFNVGGLASIIQVPGYYRNEFRCDSFQLISLAHAFPLTKKRKITLRYVEAQVSTLDLISSPHQSLKIQGANVGIFWPVQALKGLPLVVSYGQGVNVTSKMAEKNRQEVFFGAAAAF
ncbi:MAG: hypothetical protein QNL04_12955 [SAR324 cluster bacterium]|nr:hypothetical protein [SAR324 cluster bacterium]